MVDYWSNFRCLRGVPLFNAIVLGEPLNSVLQNLVFATSHYRMVQSIFQYLEPFRQTGGLVDRLCHNNCHASLCYAAKNLDRGGVRVHSECSLVAMPLEPAVDKQSHDTTYVVTSCVSLIWQY